MNIVTGMAKNLPAALLKRMAQYRYRVFVQQLKWNLNWAGDGIELDQFDRDDTVYVVAQKDDETLIGTARLLPTTGPYLLGEIFPHLLNDQPPPACESVWELSRFAAVDFNSSAAAPDHQFPSRQAAALLRAAMDCALSFGANRLVAVSPLGVERLLRREKIPVYRGGNPVRAGSQLIFASWIPLA